MDREWTESDFPLSTAYMREHPNATFREVLDHVYRVAPRVKWEVRAAIEDAVMNAWYTGVRKEDFLAACADAWDTLEAIES